MKKHRMDILSLTVLSEYIFLTVKNYMRIIGKYVCYVFSNYGLKKV